MVKRDLKPCESARCTCDGCHQNIVAGPKGGAFFQCRTSGCNCDFCYKCTMFTLPEYAEAEKFYPSCPKGHKMVKRMLKPGENPRCSCDGCRSSISGGSAGSFFFQCRTSGCNCDYCAQCSCNMAPDPFDLPTAGSAPIPKCTKGHTMVKLDLKSGESSRCTCDGCHKVISGGAHGDVMYQCRTSGCNCDYCSTCAAQHV